MLFEVTSLQIQELLGVAVNVRDILEQLCVVLERDERHKTSYFLDCMQVLLDLLRVDEVTAHEDRRRF